MLAAHDEHMTNGEYVFFNMQENPDTTDIRDLQIWRQNDTRDKEARDAMETVFHVAVFSNFTDADMKILGSMVTKATEAVRKPPWSTMFPYTRTVNIHFMYRLNCGFVKCIVKLHRGHTMLPANSKVIPATTLQSWTYCCDCIIICYGYFRCTDLLIVK